MSGRLSLFRSPAGATAAPKSAPTLGPEKLISSAPLESNTRATPVSPGGPAASATALGVPTITSDRPSPVRSPSPATTLIEAIDWGGAGSDRSSAPLAPE